MAWLLWVFLHPGQKPTAGGSIDPREPREEPASILLNVVKLPFEHLLFSTHRPGLLSVLLEKLHLLWEADNTEPHTCSKNRMSDSGVLSLRGTPTPTDMLYSDVFWTQHGHCTHKSQRMGLPA